MLKGTGNCVILKWGNKLTNVHILGVPPSEQPWVCQGPTQHLTAASGPLGALPLCSLCYKASSSWSSWGTTERKREHKRQTEGIKFSTLGLAASVESISVGLRNTNYLQESLRGHFRGPTVFADRAESHSWAAIFLQGE